MGLLARPEDAEDAVQEVFMAMVRSRRRLADVRDLAAYMFAALRRAAGRIAARQANTPIAAHDIAAQTAASPQVQHALNPHGERLERALRALPPQQREVIALRIDGQLTFAQVAQVLRISINTAASRYRYALEKLRASLRGPSPAS